MFVNYKFIFCKFVFAETYENPNPLNLAYGKDATQSSNYFMVSHSQYAVDGDTAARRSSTNRIENQWWRVDLGRIFLVYKVMTFNRQGSSEF